MPLYRDPKSDMPVTQFNMKWVEQAGLVKFDFLGLKTLTVLDVAAKLMRRRGIELDLLRIPLDDAKTYEMLARGETVGVFQVESQGMRRALIDMVPDRFEDIIALVALYRPGPMANIPTLLRPQARGRDDRLPASEARADPARTYGVIIYQEQVMQIARRCLPATASARPTCCAAPWARRSARRWWRNASASSPERDERGRAGHQAEAIFDLLARFAEYGFNKSHAAAYALRRLSDRLPEGELSRPSSWPPR